jgi:DNA-binding SARP family transcriptional activator
MEPYLNLYSGRAAGAEEDLDLSAEDVASFKEMLQMWKEGRLKIEPRLFSWVLE